MKPVYLRMLLAVLVFLGFASTKSYAVCDFGSDTCLPGFVWRGAFPGDHVCVTGTTRDQTANDNSLANQRRSPTGGPFGPDTCLPGFVWREASSSDHVCVIGSTRAQVAADNAQANVRRDPQCAIAQVTRPSDVFFFTTPPGPQVRRVFWFPVSGLDLLNRRPAESIIARDVVVRGWLLPHDGDKVPRINLLMDNETRVAIEDALYDFVIDIDDAMQRYGVPTGHVLASATINGNPAPAARILPVRDFILDGPSTTVRANSFWLDGQNVHGSELVGLHLELNAWHAKKSNLGGIFGWDYHYNYASNGPPPSGWIEKSVFFIDDREEWWPDHWWPWDPSNPDGSAVPLAVGDYVEVTGTLWQDGGHGSSGCFQTKFPGHEGWLEIHPIDKMRRVPSPPLPPKEVDNGKRIDRLVPTWAVRASACAPQGDSQAMALRVCPNETFDPTTSARSSTPTTLQPVLAREEVDGRMSDSSGTDSSISIFEDCVDIRMSASGAESTTPRYRKATYLIGWENPQSASALELTGPTQLELKAGAHHISAKYELHMNRRLALPLSTVDWYLDGVPIAHAGGRATVLFAPRTSGNSLHQLSVRLTDARQTAASASLAVSVTRTITPPETPDEPSDPDPCRRSNASHLPQCRDKWLQ